MNAAVARFALWPHSRLKTQTSHRSSFMIFPFFMKPLDSVALLELTTRLSTIYSFQQPLAREADKARIAVASDP